MNEELKKIVQNMIDAGESEENIALVIQSYKSKKPEVVAEETASVAAETPAVEDTELVSEDISLDGQPEWEPKVFTSEGEVDTAYYEDLGIMEVEKQNYNTWKENQYNKAEQDFYTPGTAVAFTKPSDIANKLENIKQINLEVENKLKSLDFSKAKDEKDVIADIDLAKQDLILKDPILKEQITKTSETLNKQLERDVKEITDKFNLDMNAVAQDLSTKYDLSNADQVELANKELDKIRSERLAKAQPELDELNRQYESFRVGALDRMQESPIFKNRVQLINESLNEQATPYLREWKINNLEGFASLLKYVDNTPLAQFIAGSEQIGQSFEAAKISLKQLGVNKIKQQVDEANASNSGLGIRDDQTVYVYPDGAIDFDKSGIKRPAFMTQAPSTPREGKFDITGKLITKRQGVFGEVPSEPMTFADYKKMQEVKKQEFSEDIKINLEEMKAFDDVLSLVEQPEFLDEDGATTMDVINTVFRMSPQLGISIGGGLLTPATGGSSLVASTALMFGQEYGSNYWEALKTGLREEIKEKEGIEREPTNDEIVDALINNKYQAQGESAGWAAVSSLLEQGTALRGAKSLKGLNNSILNLSKKLGYEDIKDMLIKTGKNNFNDMLRGGGKLLVKSGKSGINEFFTEGAQALTNQAAVSQALGGTAVDRIDIKNTLEEGIAGGVMGIALPGIPGMVKGGSNFIRQTAYKASISNVEAKKFDKFFKDAALSLQDLYDNGKITKEEYQQQSQEIANLKNSALKIPKNFGPKARQKSLDLMLERQKLQTKIKNEDEAFTGPAKQRVLEINKELGNIQSVETATRAAVKAVEKADIDLNVIELDNEVDVENYLKENMNIAASKAKEAGKQRGFIMPDGKTIIINKDVASKEGAVTTAAHEILHGVLFNTLNKGDESAFALANAIKMQLSNISTEDFKSSDLAARIEQYKADPDINEATKAEEVLTLFSEALAIGDIKFNENVFTKIKDFVRRILQNAGFSKIDFNDSKDVYNFIKDYNKSVAKGKFTKAQVKAAKEGVAVGRRLKERVEDVAEKGVDETILKFSKQASDNVQKIYEEQGVGGALDIIEEFKPIVNKIVQRRSEAPNFDRQLLTDEIETGRRGLLELIQDYNIESGVPLAAYINKFLPARAIEASKRVLGETFEEDISQRVDIAAPEVEVEVKVKEEKVPRSLRKKLNIEKGSDLYNKVKDAVVKTFGTKLPEVTDPKFKKALSDSYKRELKKEVNALMGTRSDFKMFVTNNAETLYKSIPQETINKRFQAFSEPVLDKDGKPVREKTAVGKGVFKKKPFNKEEFINYFLGEDVGASTKGTRKTALSETIADEMALDATMEVIEDPKVFEKFKEIQEIEGKKVPKDIKPKISEKVKRPEGFKFSLSTKPIQDQLNELALLRDKKAIAKYLGFNSEAINESNREELQAIMQEAVEKGYIDKAVIEAGAMASGGRQTFYGNENTRFDNYYKAKKAGIKNIGKYFKTKDGNFYRFADAVVVNNSVLAKNTDKYKKQIANVDPALWIAKPGRLYWSKEDPAYIKLFEKAKDSQFDKNGYKQINISKKGKFIGQENLINKLDKKVKGTNKTQSEINMDMLDHVVTQLSKAVDNGMSMDIAGMIIIQSYQATGGLIKTAAPFKYISDVFEAGDKIETRSKKLYREEHNPPASVVGANLLWAIKNNAAKPMMKEVRKNFSQTILSKKDDSKLDVNYAATMPIGTNMSTNPIIRMAMAGINLNTVSDIRTRQTYADKFGLGVDNKFKNIENVADYQNKLIEEVTLKGLDIKEAKKQLDQYLKIAPSQLKASKSTNKTLNDSKVLDVEGNLNIQDLLSKAASIDEALNIARDVNAPIKKIRVFDFDDTLATTKSDVLFTAPDGTEGKLNAEEFAKRGKQLLDEGYVFDFSEFNKVTKGKPGPLLEVAKKIQAARGTEDVFVLTARAPEAQVAIKEFLDGVGLNIPLENITGLGNSTGEAKANWMIDKAAEGYNDFYFADDAYQNVRAVKDAMSVLDVKSKVQQAKFSLAKDLNSDFNKILENKTGIGAEKVYSDARAKTVGSNKGKFKFFIPPSAEDFVGLLYPTLAKGKLGDQQMAWYKERLLNPFARAMENLSRDRVNLMNDFKALKKELEVPKDLRKEAIDGFTNEQAVRVYLWNKQGLDIPGISKRDLKDLTEVIDKNPKLKVFADQLQAINKSEGYPAPQDSWLVGTITTDLINGLNTVKRAKYLEEWQTNADIIFSKENLNKMEAVYGPKYREAMENILSRMKTGKNRLFSESRIGNQVLDYINGSIGAIMFFNTRSAVLQTISSINFINWSDNNIYKAGKAFANQPQYWKDFTTLMNSDFLKDRRQGLKLNISESEIADAAKTSKNKAKAALNYILQKGFLPTQIADSFAIASGGATFYRNKINSLVKEGVSEKEAEAIAYREFREIAEESQQSSRPDKISQQQASNVGRVILAFANTPSQYARIIKKAVSDLKNKRGNWKNNVSKIIYYGAMQNLIFNILQQALFAVGFGDDEEESKEREKKYISIGNGMIDSLLRGLGYGGAAVSVAKNLLLDVYERSKRDRPEYVDAAWKLLDFSPPIDSKVSKLKAAGYMVDKYGDDMISKGFAIDNPAYEAASKVVSATTNVPLDRVFTKANNISAAMGEDAETWQRVALMLGWPEWQLKPKEKKKREEKKQAVKSSVLKGFKTIK